MRICFSFLGSKCRVTGNGCTHPFINLPMLQLNKSGTNGCNVALLIGEGHPSCPFWILEFRVCVDPSITHSSVQAVHNHCKLNLNKNMQQKLIRSKQDSHTTAINSEVFIQVYLHEGDEGHLLQKWSFLGPMAESRPLQSHYHLGSRAGSGPTKHMKINMYLSPSSNF